MLNSTHETICDDAKSFKKAPNIILYGEGSSTAGSRFAEKCPEDIIIANFHFIQSALPVTRPQGRGVEWITIASKQCTFHLIFQKFEFSCNSIAANIQVAYFTLNILIIGIPRSNYVAKIFKL